MDNTNKIGLVLGSGAARGLAHIGVIKGLLKAGVRIDYVAGTSIGALIGGLFASGMSVEQMEEIACNTDWRSMTRLFKPANPFRGIIGSNAIQDFIEALVGKTEFRDLKIPFNCIATNLLDGEEIVLESGYLAEAIMASLSVPALFRPVMYRGNYLVDGGLVNPLPVDTVRKMGAETIIAVNVTPPVDRPLKRMTIRKKPAVSFKNMASSSKVLRRRLAKFAREQGINLNGLRAGRKEKAPKNNLKNPSIIETITQSIVITQNKIIRLRLADHPADILLEPKVSGFQLLDFTNAGEVIESGKMCVDKQKEAIRRLLLSPDSRLGVV